MLHYKVVQAFWIFKFSAIVGILTMAEECSKIVLTLNMQLTNKTPQPATWKGFVGSKVKNCEIALFFA